MGPSVKGRRISLWFNNQGYDLVFYYCVYPERWRPTLRFVATICLCLVGRGNSLHSCQLSTELQHSLYPFGIVGFSVNPQYRLGAGEPDEQP
jgi:hypothetical protein